jgi:hypothetical protein
LLRIYKVNFLLIPIVLVSFVGLISFGQYNVFPAASIFEAVAFLIVGWLSWRMSEQIAILSVFIFIYISYFYARAIFTSEANLFDIIVATKAFIYLLLIGLATGKKILMPLKLERLFNILLVVFLVKYLYSIIFSLDDRPGVFTENNFELMTLFILAIGVKALRGNLYKAEIFALLFITALSGSRSGAIELMFLIFLGIHFNYDIKLSLYKRLPTLAMLLIVVVVGFFILDSRSSGGIEAIDRYRFLMLFIDETSSWSIWQWAVGSAPLTALSSSTCSSLYYYQQLFSFNGDGSCYSVIFHSMLLRAVFDHGLLSLLFINFFLWKVLKKSGYNSKTIVQVIGVLAINGLSVSSFNSIFAVLPIMLLVMVNMSEKLRISRAC